MADATEKLNEALELAEQFMEGLDMGVTASVTLFHDEDAQWVHELRFGKAEGKWQLLVESSYQSRYDSVDTTPLLRSSREFRAMAVTKLEELVEALINTAEKQSAELTARADLALNTIGRLRGEAE